MGSGTIRKITGPKSRRRTARSNVILAPPKSGPIASVIVIRQQPCAQNVMGSILRRYTTQISRLLISTVENRDFFDVGNVVITFTRSILTGISICTYVCMVLGQFIPAWWELQSVLSQKGIQLFVTTN